MPASQGSLPERGRGPSGGGPVAGCVAILQVTACSGCPPHASAATRQVLNLTPIRGASISARSKCVSWFQLGHSSLQTSQKSQLFSSQKGQHVFGWYIGTLVLLDSEDMQVRHPEGAVKNRPGALFPCGCKPMRAVTSVKSAGARCKLSRVNCAAIPRSACIGQRLINDGVALGCLQCSIHVLIHHKEFNEGNACPSPHLEH